MGRDPQSYFLHTLRALPVSFALVALSGCTLLLQPPSASIGDELGRAIDLGFDGIIVHVNQAGATESYSAGWNDREALEPADPGSLFKIASISKLYIAAATTMLVADGTLSLDETLDDFLPGVAPRIENAAEITLRMLIQHRSGIPDFVWHPDYPFEPLTDNDDTYQYILDRPADFEPGRRYSYSNTNYFLIGEILDDVLGYSHHQYIRDEILTPLGLSDTYLLLSEVDLNDVMSGYIVGYEPDFRYQEHIQPGGSMVATAEDVAVFVRALVDGTLLTPEEQAIYTSVYEYEHTGWVAGYTSIVRYHSDIDAVVVQFVNTSSGQLFWLDLERVYERVVRTLERNSL
jgi:CubicO group peptidase (beta-lactamase class C family)